MNCLEFRHRLMADPNDQSAEFLDHAAGCASCRAELEHSLAVARGLEQALQSTAPQGLGDRIMLQGHFRARRQDSSCRRGIALLVFAVLVAAGLGYFLADLGSPGLEHRIFDSIAQKPALLEDPPAQWVDETRVASLLEGMGGRLDGNLGQVRHAMRCRLGSSDALHLVVQGETGPVTLFLLPNEAVDAPLNLHGDGLKGVILPHQAGSIAVIGRPGEKTLRIGEKASKAVRWEN